MKLPPPLQRGDRVCIMSPSGPVNEERLVFGISILKKWGLVVDVDPQCYLTQRYLAGSDEERRVALQNAIDDPAIKAVFFSRGGYGLSRIVSDLRLDHLRESPKWFIGFSDISVFLLSLFQQDIGGAVHGPVVASFAMQEESIPALQSLVFGQEQKKIKGKIIVSKPDVCGPLWGGNLSLVVAELATGEITIPKNAVVFLEDVGEADYRLDRLLTIFARAAKGANIQAVLLGTFNDCSGTYVDESDMKAYIEELASELSERLKCTVLTELPVGHTSENISLLLGSQTWVRGDEVQILRQYVQ